MVTKRGSIENEGINDDRLNCEECGETCVKNHHEECRRMKPSESFSPIIRSVGGRRRIALLNERNETPGCSDVIFINSFSFGTTVRASRRIL